MANDFAYIIKAIDEFTAPTNGIIRSLDKLNRQVRTSNRLMLNQNTIFRKTVPELNNAGQGMKKASESASLFGLSLGKVAVIAAGYKGWQFSKELFRVQTMFQGVNASFEAIIPKFGLAGSKSSLAAKELEWLKNTTNELGVSFESSTRSYSKFLASSNMGIGDTRKTFRAFAGLSSLLGLSGDEFEGTIRALGQMQSKTSITAEELKGQLGDRMPMAVQIFAEAAGVSIPKFLKLMEKGQLSADLMAKVADLITTKYSKDIEKASHNLQGSANRTSNSILELKHTIGDILAPTMKTFTEGTGKAADGLNNFLKAFKDKDKFDEMNAGLKIMIYSLKKIGQLAKLPFKLFPEGAGTLGEEDYSPQAIENKKIYTKNNVNKTAKDIVLDQTYKQSMYKNLRNSASRYNGDEDKTGYLNTKRRQQAYSIENLLNRNNKPQEIKATVLVDFKNVPKNADITLNNLSSSYLNLGSNVSYGSSY